MRSLDLYNVSQLRTWNYKQIKYRENCVSSLESTIMYTLEDINKAWDFKRIETPSLIPLDLVSPEYNGDDIFILRDTITNGWSAAMRPETTQGSYLFAKKVLSAGIAKLPLCVWQVGQSHRRELSDGATASKLRFNQFWQAEWQCIYSKTTKADYHTPVENAVAAELKYLCRTDSVRLVKSDRLPSYSEQTIDVEVPYNGQWKEVCSISKRKDFSEDAYVLEVAVGLDRIVEIANI